MKCPIDNETLVISERSGVEIDYCPKCRGVWLDRGELDKIVERSGVVAAAAGDTRRGSKKGGYKSRKKDSFLGELFDF